MTKRAAKSPPPKSYALDAHHRVFASVVMSILAVAVMYGKFGLPTEIIVAWDAFAFTDIALAWTIIATKDPYDARRNARIQDSSATFLFTLVIFAATASLLAVGFLLSSAKHLGPTALAEHLALSVTAVILSWFLVHTIFTLRYAHFYFWDAHKVEREAVSGGLLFPGKHSPDFLDFAYFSFVIGMTCQTSDVNICSPRIRHLALLHGVISFAFNTAILAMCINIIAGLV